MRTSGAPFAEQQRNVVVTQGGHRFEAGLWADIIRPDDVEVIAAFEADFHAGRPAITRNRWHEVQACCIATRLDQARTAWAVDQLVRAAGVQGFDAPRGVELDAVDVAVVPAET